MNEHCQCWKMGQMKATFYREDREEYICPNCGAVRADYKRGRITHYVSPEYEEQARLHKAYENSRVSVL